jgi:hypothetical protein
MGDARFGLPPPAWRFLSGPTTLCAASSALALTQPGKQSSERCGVPCPVPGSRHLLLVRSGSDRTNRVDPQREVPECWLERPGCASAALHGTDPVAIASSASPPSSMSMPRGLTTVLCSCHRTVDSLPRRFAAGRILDALPYPNCRVMSGGVISPHWLPTALYTT